MPVSVLFIKFWWTLVKYGKLNRKCIVNISTWVRYGRCYTQWRVGSQLSMVPGCFTCQCTASLRDRCRWGMKLFLCKPCQNWEVILVVCPQGVELNEGLIRVRNNVTPRVFTHSSSYFIQYSVKHSNRTVQGCFGGGSLSWIILSTILPSCTQCCHLLLTSYILGICLCF